MRIRFRFPFYCLGSDEADIEWDLEIHADYYEGSNGTRWDPPEGPELDIAQIVVLPGDGRRIEYGPSAWDDWIDEHHDELCEAAADEIQAEYERHLGV